MLCESQLMNCIPLSTLRTYSGGQIINFSERIQQRNPLGSSLFCLTIHPLVMSVQSEFWIFYVDDSLRTLGGYKDECCRTSKVWKVKQQS